MNWAGLLRFARLPLPVRTFVIIAIVGIIVTRVLVILATPRTTDFLDPRIYQGTGQAVLAGVNPYDYSDHAALRASLRAKMASGKPGSDDFTDSQASWDYYVSGNLPASTALYALFELIAGDSRFEWRLLFILGDIGIFLGLIALFTALRRPIGDASVQAGMFCLAVINPVLIVSGCAIPEDKQFQTALMLFAAALLCAASNATFRRGLWTGLILSLSTLFKLLGVFLTPLWFAQARRAQPRFILGTLVGGLIPVAAAFAAFGHYFVGTMTARGVQNSIQGAEHASPWVLVPWLHGVEYIAAKAAAAALFCGVLVALLLKRRIDLLNFCAGVSVAFVCLWLDKGAMNRMNIAIMFAVGALASLSGRLFAQFSAAMVAAAAIGYAVGVGALKLHPESVDSVFVLIFVLAYLATLLRRPATA